MWPRQTEKFAAVRTCGMPKRGYHHGNLRQALARARSIAAPGDRVVVFGSFFTVAAALPKVQRESQAREAAS